MSQHIVGTVNGGRARLVGPTCCLSAHLEWPKMVSLLFFLGILVGMVGVVIAVGGVLIAVVAALAWLNSAVVSARRAARRAQLTG